MNAEAATGVAILLAGLAVNAVGLIVNLWSAVFRGDSGAFALWLMLGGFAVADFGALLLVVSVPDLGGARYLLGAAVVAFFVVKLRLAGRMRTRASRSTWEARDP